MSFNKVEVKTVNVLMLAFHDEPDKVRPVVVIHDAKHDSLDDILNQVYHYGQNDNCHDRTITFTTCSVSKGDVIVLDDEYYLVASMGFTKISAEQLEAYKALPRRDRWTMDFDNEY